MDERHEAVIVDDLLGNEFDGYAHVFGTFERRVEVEIFHIRCHEVSGGFGDDTVQEEFDCGEASRFGGYLAWVIDAVATDGNAASVGFFFLRSDVGTESGIGDGAAGGDGIDQRAYAPRITGPLGPTN